MELPIEEEPRACPGGAAGARVWGHPVRNLELFAWHWLAGALARAPERAEMLWRLMQRLEEATASLVVAETMAVGWVPPPAPDGDVLDALEKIVAVMREIGPMVDRSRAGG